MKHYTKTLSILALTFMLLFSTISITDARRSCNLNGQKVFSTRCGTTLTNGLIGYYKLDDTSGTTVTNEVGADAVKVGNIDSVKGHIRRGFDFSVSPLFNFVDTQTPIGAETTVSFWMNPSVSSDAWGTMQDSNGQDGYAMQYNTPGEIRIEYRENGLLKDVILADISAEMGNNNNWVYITFTVDNNNNAKVYVNGAETPYTAYWWTVVPSQHDRDLVIGQRDIQGSAGSFNGILDEFGVWNRALNTEEVRMLYRNGKGRTY